MFSKVFLVLFLSLALLSSVARALPSLPARDKNPSSCSVSSDDTSKKGSSDKNKAKDNGKGANDKGGNNDDPQKSLTLDPKVLAKGFAQNGQENQTAPGQVASLTSSNNFINFCLTVNKPLTNGQQIKSGSCNPCPMGEIPDTKHMPSSKFTSPKNFGVIKANTNFTIDMKILNLETGNFVNADNNYYAAPQQLEKTGKIIGHTHFVVQPVDSFASTKPLDPTKFTFFKGVNSPADKNNVVSVSVDQGLPEGQYRLASINTAANHQPVLAPVAQHGSLDDMIYFSVTKDGKSSTSSGDAAGKKKENKNKSVDDGDKNKSDSNNDKNKDKSKTADPSSCQLDKATSNSPASSVNDHGSERNKYQAGKYYQ